MGFGFLLNFGGIMCDGFSEAFAAAAAGASAEAAATVVPLAEASTLSSMGAGLGAAYSAVGGMAGVMAGSSALMTGYSTYSQANAQQQAAKYQSQVNANNAIIAGQQRSAAIQQGQIETENNQLQQAQILGQQKATLAANGVDLSSGSAVDQLATTRFLGAQAINAIQANAARAAWGYQVQAGSEQGQSALSAWQANSNNPLALASFASATSLLNSASHYRTTGG